MKNKVNLIVLGILMVLIAFHCLSRLRVIAHRSDYTHRLHASALPLSPVAIKALAGEFNGIIADYLILEVASFNGRRISTVATQDDWDAVARLLEQSSVLDPYFKQTYRLAQSMLPWEAKKYDETLAILERSKEHLSWDWEPGFYLGFDYHFFLKDNLTASKKLMEASKIEGAPVMLASLASRLAAKAGQVQTALIFLSALYENTENEGIKVYLKKRIDAFKGVLMLQWAVEQFRKQFGRMPDLLDELVEHSIIPAIPANPYNRPYTLSNGMVDF